MTVQVRNGRVDVFPAIAYIGETVYQPAYVRVTEREANVWVEGRRYPNAEQVATHRRGPISLAATIPGPLTWQAARTSVTVTNGQDDDVPVMHVDARGGCGCGSALRGWRPPA